MAKLKREGWIVLRTAGSHGPFDLVAISPPSDAAPQGIIQLIQVKGGENAERERRKALSETAKFAGDYRVEVLTR